MVERTWETRELPLLEAVVEAHEAERPIGNVQRLAELLGAEVEEMRRSLEALYDDAYVTGANGSSWQGGFDLINIRPTPKARRLVGQWPSEDRYDAVMELLAVQIEGETDEERRTLLQRLQGAISDAPRAVAVSVLSAVLKGGLG